MRIRVYQSDKGDCLLVTGSGAKGGNILVDGGMRDSFRKHVRDDLGRLAADKQKLDLVYVSHIDQDHISGILELLDNVMAWRVFKYRSKNGGTAKQPAFAEMPEIDEIWHNAFSAMVGENAGPVERLLAQSSLVMGLSTDKLLQEDALVHHELAYSIEEALKVSQRVSASQLRIPLNSQFGGKLILSRSPARREARVGAMDLYVLGPFSRDVKKLMDEWNTWLRSNKARITAIKKAAEGDARSIGNSADRISELLAARVDELGKRDKVTTPNLASVMLLLEEGARTVLLTGDGHSSDILKGLKHHGRFDANGELHVDVLKVPHHGAEYNMKSDFTDKVSADHYIFCGNGKHKNPDERIVTLICDSHRARRPNDTFTLWFNCAPDVAPEGEARKHMKKIEALVDKKAAAAGGKIKARFLKQSSFDLTI